MTTFFIPLSSLSPSFQDHMHYQAAASDGSIGLFPASAILDRSPVPMHPMPWFHGAITRLESEKLLDRNQDGQFLFRTSQNTKGIYALALRLVHNIYVTGTNCAFFIFRTALCILTYFSFDALSWSFAEQRV